MHCRRDSFLSRVVKRLAHWRNKRACGDYWIDDAPPGSFVREPRRPRPGAPSSAVALELPPALL